MVQKSKKSPAILLRGQSRRQFNAIFSDFSENFHQKWQISELAALLISPNWNIFEIPAEPFFNFCPYKYFFRGQKLTRIKKIYKKRIYIYLWAKFKKRALQVSQECSNKEISIEQPILRFVIFAEIFFKNRKKIE